MKVIKPKKPRYKTNYSSIQLTKEQVKTLNLIKLEMDLRNFREVVDLLVDNYRSGNDNCETKNNK